MATPLWGHRGAEGQRRLILATCLAAGHRQVREGHFQACELLATTTEMTKVQTLELRSPHHCPLCYPGIPDRASSSVAPLSVPWSLALSPALLSASVEVKMSSFPGRHPGLVLSPHAVPSSLCLLALSERSPQSRTVPPNVAPPALTSLLSEHQVPQCAPV